MAKVTITKRHGKNVTISAEHFAEFVRRIKLSVGGSVLSSSGGGCEDGCDDACEFEDGCDFAFGSPGDCGWACNNGEVVLEL